jgi:type I restriction enzyme S subunit
MAEPIARACIIPIDNERYLMASDGIRLSIDKKRFNLRFVLETINQKRFRSIAEIRSTGTTRSRIGLTELKGIPVCYPQKNEQDIIGIKLDNLEESIEIEQSALSKYQQLKAGLMQDLLTGKVEVSVAEEIVKN